MPSNNYTRQKAAEIQDNLTINASIFNAEYNQIQLAFSYASTGETGHTHSGAAGEGGAIGKIGNQDFSKSLEISTNDWVFTGSSVQPATENTTDLGVSGKGWKDVYVSGNVDLSDNAKARFGTGNDLQIWHSGTDSYIQDFGTGDLNIISNGADIKLFDAANNVNLAAFVTGGAAKLYWAGNNPQVRLETTEAGIDVIGTVTADGVRLGDNDQIQLGDQTDGDLKIYHSGGHSFIEDVGTGNLVIRGQHVEIKDLSNELKFYASDGASGAVQLYYGHDTAAKLTTTSAGIDVTGTVDCDEISFSSDSSDYCSIKTTVDGTSTKLDFQIKDDDNDTFRFRFDPSANASEYLTAVEIKPDQSVSARDKFILDVTGTVAAEGVNLGNNEKITFGGTTSPNLEIYETSGGTGLIVQEGSGDLVIKGQIGSLQNDAGSSLLQWDATNVALYWRGTSFGQRLVTTETGIDVTGTVDCDGLKMDDGEYAQFGTGNDLQIFHTGINSHIKDRGTGILSIETDGDRITMLDSVNARTMAQFNTGGTALLSWAGATGTGTKLETTATGIDVTGTTNTDNLTINGAQGSDGQVLTSTGSGVAWEDAATGGGGSVTAVTGTAPIASSGGTAPAISISQASGSTDGYLSSTDWTTFNNKGAGTLTGVTEGAAIDINTNNAASPTISVDLSELTVETDNLVGSTDHLVYLDNGNQKRILANNVNLSAFDNDVGWTNNAGTVTSVSGGTGITVTGGGVSPSVSITSDSIGATQLNVSGNGAATDFLRSDGDGTFTWATPVDTDTTYTADNTTIDLTGTEFSVKDNGIGATQLNVSGNGSSSQFLRSDGDGTFTWATPTDTNTTYTAGTGLDLTGTDFNLSLNELATTTSATSTSYLVLSGTVGNKILLESINNHLFGQDVQELNGFGPGTARRDNSIKVVDTSSADKTVVWNTGVEGAYYTVHAIGANDINYVIPSGTTVYITGPSGLITKTFGSTVTIKGGSSCTVTAYGSSETFIYTGNNVTYS